MKKEENKEYCFSATCHVCGRKFKARYNVRDRARVCTPPEHECKRKIVKIEGKGDKAISCVDGCCRSKYYKGVARAATSTALDSRKYLNDDEYKEFQRASRKLKPPFGIGLRFTMETGCRCGETLLVRKRHLEFSKGPLSIVRIPTLKKPGHPLLPVHLDNESSLVAELQEWAKDMKPADFLFSMSKRTFQRVFERILDEIKPDRVGLVHLLRHTRASRLVASGLPPTVIQEEMRWGSIELLQVYAHTTEDVVSKAFRKIR